MHSQVSWSAGGCRLFEPQKTDRLYSIVNERQHNNNMFILVIPSKSARPREAGWLDERTQRSFALLRMTEPQAVILSAAKDL